MMDRPGGWKSIVFAAFTAEHYINQILKQHMLFSIISSGPSPRGEVRPDDPSDGG